MDVELILAMNGLAMRRDWTIENLITQLSCESSSSLLNGTWDGIMNLIGLHNQNTVQEGLREDQSI